MSRRQFVILAGAGSFALLLGAYLFQALGFPPCRMCYWQRWPHMVAVIVAVLYVLRPYSGLIWIGLMATLTTAIIGVYHTGVERDIFEGPTSCTGGGLSGVSGSDLLSTESPMVTMCDQVSWSLLGLSMASWNAIFSFGLAFIWILALRKKPS